MSTDPDFTLEELLEAIKGLKNNKATGLDRIPAEMIKTSSESIMMILLKTMNKIKSTFRCPTTWAAGITSLLFKDGDKDDPNDYRAITVTDALSKILASLFNNRLEKWCTANNIIKKEQIGFEKKSRPGDHLFVLKSLIDHYNQQGKKIYACFVDFQKAFDSVWRMGLLYKLIKYGVNIGYIKLIKDMYDKTTQALRINNLMTRMFHTYKGVKQGCILSPKLFNLFINDLPDIFVDDDNCCSPVFLTNETKINCLMYADDLILLSESKDGLQSCLDRLYDYTQQWDLKLNLKKTKIMIFQNTGRRIPTSFTFGENVVQAASEYKYLGTVITNTGNFRLNEIKLKQRGLRASFIITKNIGPYAKPSTSIRIFEKIVEPILLHNSEISGAYFPNSWNYEKFVEKMWDVGEEINKVVLGFLRQLLGVHKKSCNKAVMAETGKYPICIKIYTRIIKYWLRAATTENCLIKSANKLNENNYNKGNPSWTKIVMFLRKYTNSIDNPGSENMNNSITNRFKKVIRQKYDEWWSQSAEPTGSNKLDFYYRYKKTFTFEKYLDNIPKHIRIHITRLRLSSHSLPIEVLRYKKKDQKIERENRKCTICNTNATGDEMHYLLKCNNAEISHARDQFFSDIKCQNVQFRNLSDQNITDYCMLMSDTNAQLLTAKYVMDILNTYKEEIGGPSTTYTPPTETKSGRTVRKPIKLDL